MLAVGTAAIIMLACSLAVALVCVRHEGRAVDRLLRGLLFLGTSVPAFWAGLLLIWLFSVHLDWLPTGGLEGPSSLVLPAVTLALPYLAAYARLLRNSMVRTAQEDFVLYARACGRSRGAVLRMVLRNSLQASLTALGMSLPKLVAGSFVVECIFAWPGLGRLCVTAIFNLIFPSSRPTSCSWPSCSWPATCAWTSAPPCWNPRLRERGLRRGACGHCCMTGRAWPACCSWAPCCWRPWRARGWRPASRWPWTAAASWPPAGPNTGWARTRAGRDIFSRLLYGARATLGVSLLAMMATVCWGPCWACWRASCAGAGGGLRHAPVRRDALLPRRGHGAGHRGHAGAGAGERGAGLRGGQVALVRAHDADRHPPLRGQGLRAFRARGGLRHGPHHPAASAALRCRRSASWPRWIPAR